MVIGAAIKYWAISNVALRGQTLFGLDAQVFWASIGFAVFAVGVEVSGITVSKIIVKWFKGKELATAMGMQVAMARIGTAMALGFSVPIAKATGVIDVSRPVLIALIGLCIGLIAFFVYVVMDKKLDISEASGAEERQIRRMNSSCRISERYWVTRGGGILPFCVYFSTQLYSLS